MNNLAGYASLLNLASSGLSIRTNQDLTTKTQMRMKTHAAIYAVPENPFALKKILRETKRSGVPTFLLGGGANTLFATSYFDGVVISLGRGFQKTEYLGGNFIRAGASTKLPALMKYARDCGLMGLEFLTMIPGTVGGALAGNAGAGNWGLCDYVERVYLMTRAGFIACVDRNQFRYAYRHSELREAIILEADFRLEPLNKFEAESRLDKFKGLKGTQPYNLPSCGCIFKNPKDHAGRMVSAGKLIDECELKGYSIKAAQVSEGHANFIVNRGNSAGEDFLALISLVRDLVHQKMNIELDLEVQIVGGPLSSAILA
ncbi:UDP-N-acetylmuramate dehydrogenase [soil metagenome]